MRLSFFFRRVMEYFPFHHSKKCACIDSIVKITRFPNYSIYIRKIFYATHSISISSEIENYGNDQDQHAQKSKGTRALLTSSLKSYFMFAGSRLLFPNSPVEAESLVRPHLSLSSSILICAVLMIVSFCDSACFLLRRLPTHSPWKISGAELFKIALVFVPIICGICLFFVIMLNKEPEDEIVQLENEILSVIAKETHRSIITQLKF